MRRRHRVALGEDPKSPVQPSALLQAHEEVGYVAQRLIDAGAVLQAKMAVTHIPDPGNPLLQGPIVGVDDKLDLNGSGSTLMVISEIVCSLSGASIPGLDRHIECRLDVLTSQLGGPVLSLLHHGLAG
jgi:hypothetical protein